MVVCVLFSAVIVIKDGAKQQQVCSHLSNSTPFSLCASATFFSGRVRRLVPVVGFFLPLLQILCRCVQPISCSDCSH